MKKMPRRFRDLTLKEAMDEVDDYKGGEKGGVIERAQMPLLIPDQVTKSGLSDGELIEEDDMEARRCCRTDRSLVCYEDDHKDEDDVPSGRFTKMGQWEKTE